MKNILLIAIIFAALVPSTIVWAGGEGVGGGDRCEERFKNVADDLRSWIGAGGPKGLVLGEVNVEDYSARMLTAIGSFAVTCVGPGDQGYPVMVSGHAKECINFQSEKGKGRIVCDRQKFYSSSAQPDADSAQYRIVHHELASLAGLEAPDGDDSHYALSQQIDGFLENRLLKKLVVKPNQDIRIDKLSDYATIVITQKTKFDRRLGIYTSQTDSLGSCELRFLNDHVAVYTMPGLALRPGTYRVQIGNPSVVDRNSLSYQLYQQPMASSVSIYFTKEQFRVPDYVMESAPLAEKEIVVELTCTRKHDAFGKYSSSDEDRWSMLSEMNKSLATIGWEIQSSVQ